MQTDINKNNLRAQTDKLQNEEETDLSNIEISDDLFKEKTISEANVFPSICKVLVNGGRSTPVQYNVNKKKNKLTTAKLYDNMISINYTLNNGQLDQEKIIQQTYSFTRKPITDT